MDAEELMRLHVRALFTQDDHGRLIAVNDSNGAPAPRFFLGRTSASILWWVRRDVSARLADELQALCEEEAVGVESEPTDQSLRSFTAVLSRGGPVERVWSGPAYECPPGLTSDGAAVRITAANADLVSRYLEAWRVDVEAGVPMAASLHEGAAVSVCCSVRVTERAHEAGVETHPDFRGRGHARRAVTEWAAAVREAGGVPLYSTSWENEPSRALASALGLRQFGVDVHIR